MVVLQLIKLECYDVNNKGAQSDIQMQSSSLKQTTGRPEQQKKQQQQQHLAYKHTFIGLPSGLTLFGRHLMAVRMIIIIWGSGNHFSLPQPPNTRMSQNNPKCTLKTTIQTAHVGGCERRLAEYKIRL